jgi:uncharacterized OsmC-like protein
MKGGEQMTESHLVTLSAKGQLISGKTNKVQIRDFEPFFIDEQERIGGANVGPNPLEYLLGALSACTSIMTSYVAKDMNFSYQGIEYATDGKLDPRGYQGVEGVLTYFQTVEVNIFVETEESDEALQLLGENVEKRCPIYNLLKDAGVEVITNWKRN